MTDYQHHQDIPDTRLRSPQLGDPANAELHAARGHRPRARAAGANDELHVVHIPANAPPPAPAVPRAAPRGHRGRVVGAGRGAAAAVRELLRFQGGAALADVVDAGAARG